MLIVCNNKKDYKGSLFGNKSLRLGLKIFFYQLVLSTAPAAANCPTGNLYVTSRGIFTPSYTENVLIKVVVQQKDILGVICIKKTTFSKFHKYVKACNIFVRLSFGL